MDNSSSNATFLQQYDETPDAEKFPLVRSWIDKNPLAFFKELREQRPVFATPVCVMVARYHDVVEILSMPQVFTVRLYGPKMADYLMTRDDDALHTREKSLMRTMLNRDDLPVVRQMIATISNDILNAAGHEIEAVKSYCRMVPATLVQDYFGLKDIDKKDLIEWSYWNQYDAFHNYPFDLVTDEMRKEIVQHRVDANAKLGSYLTRLVAGRVVKVKIERARNVLLFPFVLLQKLAHLLFGRKRGVVKDDIVMRMVRTSYPDAVDFDIRRLGVNAGGLLIGAIETTSHAVAHVIQHLLHHKQWRDTAIAAARDDKSHIFDGIVFEALRFAPISAFLWRHAAVDYTICKGTAHATTIKAGTIVLTLTQSAMFDPAAFEDPDDFIPTRDWYHYFHFGFGSHECLGKHIGMVMIPEMVRQVLLRPAITDAHPIDYKSGPLPEEYHLRWT